MFSTPTRDQSSSEYYRVRMMIISASSPITRIIHHSSWRSHTSTPSLSLGASSVWSNPVLYPPSRCVSFSRLREDDTLPKSTPQVFPLPLKGAKIALKSPYILYIIRCKRQKSRSEKGMFPAHKVAKVVVFLPKLSLCVLPHFCKSSF